MSGKPKIISLVGARPQFVKEALIGAAAREAGLWEHILVHSGQHYDSNMSDVFFQELGIPKPDISLGIGSGSHGAMTGAALAAMENVLLEKKPEALLVYGDTNTTLAGALAAAKLGVPVIHVEAGIRQKPKTMPEEINRVLTDHVSTMFCCCSEMAAENLRRENISNNIFVTGDIMFDVFKKMRPKFEPNEACARHGVQPENFALVTMHRDFNVDNSANLEQILRGLGQMAEENGLEALFFMHPRTRGRIEQFGLGNLLAPLKVYSPVGYLELMSLAMNAAVVLTDSGGLQKEAYYAGKRSVVIMPDTGWRELTALGWNILAAPMREEIARAAGEALKPADAPKNIYGEGDAAAKIVKAIESFLGRA